MDKNEKKQKLIKQRDKNRKMAEKHKEAAKNIDSKIKALDNPELKLSHKQQNTVKIWHGIACLALIKENQDLDQLVKEYLEKNVKSPYQRKLMGLTIPEPQVAPVPKKITMSTVFGRVGPILAQERIDLVVPFPDPPEAKEQAKAAGAKWDGKNRAWYVVEGFDLTKVEQWLPQNKNWHEYGLEDSTS